MLQVKATVVETFYKVALISLTIDIFSMDTLRKVLIFGHISMYLVFFIQVTDIFIYLQFPVSTTYRFCII